MKKSVLLLMAMLVASISILPAQEGKKSGQKGNNSEVVAKGKGGAKSEAEASPVEDNGARVVKGSSVAFVAPRRWYVGVGGGSAFAQSTFASFTNQGVELGYMGRIFGGYKLTHTISLEASINYLQVNGLTSDCCSGFYLSEGNKYYSNFPGANYVSYSYKDLKSTSDIYQIGFHAPINLAGSWSQFTPLHFFVIPSLSAGYVDGAITAISDGTKQYEDNCFIFGGGVDIAATYDLTKAISLRLQSGLSGQYGDISAAPDGHTFGYFWNTTLNVIYKFR